MLSKKFPSDNDVCIIKIKRSITDTLEYLKNLDWNNNMETYIAGGSKKRHWQWRRHIRLRLKREEKLTPELKSQQ